MITYSENKDLAFIDGYKFRKDSKTNYFLSSRKIDGRRKRLHVYVWEKENGNVPKGFQVHHINENKFDNEITNLQLLTISEHLSLHAKEQMQNLDKEEIKKRLDDAREKANEWHRSDEGRKWHLKQYEKTKDTLYKERTLVCKECGKTYKTISGGTSRFCSNKCKSKWRRESGIDDEIRKCEYCGKEFKVNKYAKKRFCSYECGFAAVPRGGNTNKNKKY